MPIIERLSSWLRGPKLSDLILKLNMLCKKLEWQSRKLEKEAKVNKKKARKQRLEGNDEGARVYASYYLQFKKWALNVDMYRLNIEGLIVKLRQSEAMGEVARNLRSLKYVIGSLRNNLRMPDLEKTMNEIDEKLKDVDVSKEYAETKMLSLTDADKVSKEEISKVINEIDQEIAIETGEALPEPAVKASELEKEIKKLRESGS
ncbi:MAG: Snf7 family protein [Candidatus Odinarchaeia archaeon]